MGIVIINIKYIIRFVFIIIMYNKIDSDPGPDMDPMFRFRFRFISDFCTNPVSENKRKI